mgnify:CR=1 FL=1
MAQEIRIEVTEAQYAAIRHAAEAEGLAISEYVKSVLLEAADCTSDDAEESAE